MTDVRLLAPSEFRAASDLFYASLHRMPVPDARWSSHAQRYDPARVFGAFVDGELAGTALSFKSAIAVPGGAVLTAAAVSGVGVRADRTRRGVLTSLTRAQLSTLREQGEPIAILHASETTIYGRFGYGVATRDRNLSMRRIDAEFRPELPRGGSVRLVGAEEAAKILPDIYRRIGLARPGMIERPDVWWQNTLAQHDQRVVVVHSDDAGEDDGFAAYEVRINDHHFDDGRGTMQVSDIQARDATAGVELWRFLLGVDLVDEVSVVGRPVDEPIEWWLTDRRVCRTWRLVDDLWLRLVDVPTALNARGFGAAEPVVIEVRDRFLPENSGRYRITPEGAERCDQSAQLSLDADVLAALYLGDVRVSTLVAAGRIGVRDASAVPAADDLFDTREIPWCGTGF